MDRGGEMVAEEIASPILQWVFVVWPIRFYNSRVYNTRAILHRLRYYSAPSGHVQRIIY